MIEELEPGGQFPDLQLPDAAGQTRRLSELAGEDPVVLHFFRGWWCPKERQFFRRLLDLQADAEVAYARFVSVSVDPPEVLAAFRAGLDARWTFLSDEGRRYLDALELRESTDTVHHPYLPTCLVLAPDLRVHASYNGYWYWGRPTGDELHRDLREVTRLLRPDWQLSP